MPSHAAYRNNSLLIDDLKVGTLCAVLFEGNGTIRRGPFRRGRFGAAVAARVRTMGKVRFLASE